MRLKTPVRLSRGLSMAAAGTVVLGFAGFAVTQGGPASADPHQVYTVVGSDTVQDVYNQFSLDEGANLIGSWNATNPTNLTLINEDITPNNAAAGQCSFSRPNGSGQGENALRKSINQSTTAAQLAIAPGANCIDWSRSSSGPGSDQKADGQLVFIPFAIDALTGSVGSESSSAFQTETSLLTSAQETTLYNTCSNVTMPDGTVLDPNGTGNGTTILNIDLYFPQSGSGTAKFWASKTGNWNPAAPGACVHQTIVNATNPANDGTVVEEHDGSAVSDDPQGYGPFSIAQYIAQTNGFGINRIHLAILEDINSIAPEVNGSLNLNATFTREVYDIIPFANVTSGMTGFNSQEAQLLAGTASVLCRDVITITNYGFALLPSNSSTYDACGATTANLRAFDSTDPV